MAPQAIKTIVVFVTFLLIAVVCQPTEADTFFYIDPNGTVYFTDRPEDGRFKLYEKSKDSGEEDRSLDQGVMPDKYDGLIRRICHHYRMEFELVKAVIKVESNFDPTAVSHKGAMGMMQLMPLTSKIYGVHNPYDPRQNIIGGVRYLKYLLAKFNNDLKLSLAAYNAGPTNVMKYNDIPPFPETRKYVKNVIRYRNALRDQNRNRLSSK